MKDLTPWIGDMSADERAEWLMLSGPLMTHVEAAILDAERRARAKALEEAAHIADEHDAFFVAERIRALAEPAP